jgi:hypothetical protein
MCYAVLVLPAEVISAELTQHLHSWGVEQLVSIFTPQEVKMVPAVIRNLRQIVAHKTHKSNIKKYYPYRSHQVGKLVCQLCHILRVSQPVILTPVQQHRTGHL